MILTLTYNICCVCFAHVFCSILATWFKHLSTLSVVCVCTCFLLGSCSSHPFLIYIFPLKQKKKKNSANQTHLVMWSMTFAGERREWVTGLDWSCETPERLHKFSCIMWDIEPSDQTMQCPFFLERKNYMCLTSNVMYLYMPFGTLFWCLQTSISSFFMEKHLTYQNRNIMFSN